MGQSREQVPDQLGRMQLQVGEIDVSPNGDWVRIHVILALTLDEWAEMGNRPRMGESLVVRLKDFE